MSTCSSFWGIEGLRWMLGRKREIEYLLRSIALEETSLEIFLLIVARSQARDLRDHGICKKKRSSSLRSGTVSTCICRYSLSSRIEFRDSNEWTCGASPWTDRGWERVETFMRSTTSTTERRPWKPFRAICVSLLDRNRATYWQS